MEPNLASYHISPLGDSAILVDFGNKIDEDINKTVIARTRQLKENLANVTEVVSAYSSLIVYFDLVKWKKNLPKEKLVFEHLKETIDGFISQPLLPDEHSSRLIKIPVCYDGEFAGDIHDVASANNITAEEVVALHLSRSYRVYMLGFLPGFCYMGPVDERIAISRKPQPHPVSPGSVGIAGMQTGIYPLASPGGWRIIGRTPLKLFDSYAEQPALLRAGDSVQFFAINKNDFNDIQNAPVLPEGNL